MVDGAAEIGEAGDAVVGLSDSARDDAGKMREIRIDVQRHAVKRRPAPHAHADGGDLVLGHLAKRRRRFVGPRDPHADTGLARLADDVERLQRLDQPAFERGHIGSHIRPSALEVEHHISDPLPGPVIGELAAASGAMNRKAGVDQVGVLRARAGGVKRRMLDEPNALGRVSARDRVGAHFHLRQGVGILRQSRGDHPFDRGRVIWRQERRVRRKARIEHAGFYQNARLSASRGGAEAISSSRRKLTRIMISVACVCSAERPSQIGCPSSMNHAQPIACIEFFALRREFTLDANGKVAAFVLWLFRVLSDCVVCVRGHGLGPRWPEPLVGCRWRAGVDRRRVDERIWRRMDLAAGNRSAHRDLVRLDRVRSSLGRQSPDQSNPRRRADLCSIRPDGFADRFWPDGARTLRARAADAKHLQRPRLFGRGPEGETLVDRRMGVLWRGDRIHPGRPKFDGARSGGKHRRGGRRRASTRAATSAFTGFRAFSTRKSLTGCAPPGRRTSGTET